jgi:hypothetical protein
MVHETDTLVATMSRGSSLASTPSSSRSTLFGLESHAISIQLNPVHHHALDEEWDAEGLREDTSLESGTRHRQHGAGIMFPLSATTVDHK